MSLAKTNRKFLVSIGAPSRNSRASLFSSFPLPANQSQNAGYQRHDSGDDRGDSEVKECGDSNQDQIDGEQKHSEVFSDVHESFLMQASRVCTLKKRLELY